MGKLFEIYYHDLNEDVQKDLCEAWETSEEEENWEISPLAVIEREMEDTL